MSGIGAAIIGGSAITGLLSANAQKSAAQTAANAQLQANQQALAAQQSNQAQAVGQQQTALASGTSAAGAQNNSLQALLSPFIGAGAPGIAGLNNYATGGQAAFGAQQNLAGANGNAAQANAISGVQNSPYFQQLLAQGVDTANQNASANGNLRSGTAVAGVAALAPSFLNQILQQQFTNLGSLSSQGSAASNALASLGAGSAGTQEQGTQATLAQLLGLQGGIASNEANLATGNNSTISQLLTGQGAIQGQNALAQGQANANLYNGIGSAINTVAGMQNKNNLAALLGGNTSQQAAPGSLQSFWSGLPSNSLNMGTFPTYAG